MKPLRPEMKEERKRNHTIARKTFFFPQQTSQVLFKVTLKPKKCDLMFFIYLLWSLHVFSSARALDPRSPPSSIFLLVLWRQKCQLQIKTENDLLSCGSIDSNSTFCKEGNTKCISSTLTKLPNPITPVSILWFSCTDYFLFSIINITINIKGCSCLSKPQASALHLQLSPLPVLVKPTDNNPSAILFLTGPVVCLHLLWQRFLQKAL